MRACLLVLKILFGVVVLVVASLYFRVVVYQPVERAAFHGDYWHNPYENLSEDKAYKANFHSHTHQWMGITSGHGDHSDMQKEYAQLGYHVAQTSEYNLLNGSNDISVYEHGFGLNKVHQLVFNAQAVNWMEFPLYQWTGHKNDMLHRIKTDNPQSLVVLAHPKLRNGYFPDEMRELSGYELIEVVSRFRVSTEVWDSSLMSGNPAYLLGSDDCHNVFEEEEVGRAWTWIWSDSLADLVSGLKKGRSMGIILPYETKSSIRQYHQTHGCPLDNLVVKDNQLILTTSSMDSVRLVSDGKAGKWEAIHQGDWVINLSGIHHYVRVELKDKWDVKVYLNPIIRYNPQNGLAPIQASSKIDYLKTVAYRLPPLLVILITIWYFLRLNKWNEILIQQRYFLKRKRLVE
jgi:hypothetical protein